MILSNGSNFPHRGECIYKSGVLKGVKLQDILIKTYNSSNLEGFKKASNLDLIFSLSHENIERVLGYSETKEGFSLITEFTKETFESVILNKATSWVLRIEITCHIADILYYLQNRRDPIVVFNCSRTELLQSFRFNTDKVLKLVSTPIAANEKPSWKSSNDLFNFGILMWHIFTQEKDPSKVNTERIDEISRLPSLYSNDPIEMEYIKIMNDLWSDSKPSLKEIVYHLNYLLVQAKKPPTKDKAQTIMSLSSKNPRRILESLKKDNLTLKLAIQEAKKKYQLEIENLNLSMTLQEQRNREEIDQFKTFYEDEIKSINEKIEVQKNQLKDKSKNVEEEIAQNKFQEMEQKMMDLKSNIIKLKNEKVHHQNSLDFNNQQNATYQKSITSLKEKIQQLEEIKKKLDEKVLTVEKEVQSLEKEFKNPYEEEIEKTIEIIKKNDIKSEDIILVSKNLTDSDVSRIMKAAMTNGYILKMDFSNNKIRGDCFEDVCEYLLKTKTLNELLFTGCDIKHEKIALIKKAMKENKTLVQCTTGNNETIQDIEEIEEYLQRNFELLSS